MTEDECLLGAHPCPYCESDDLYIDTVFCDNHFGCAVACMDCGMSGPVSFQGIELAVRGWETLHKKMCRHCMDRLIKENKKLHKLLKELK